MRLSFPNILCNNSRAITHAEQPRASRSVCVPHQIWKHSACSAGRSFHRLVVEPYVHTLHIEHTSMTSPPARRTDYYYTYIINCLYIWVKDNDYYKHTQNVVKLEVLNLQINFFLGATHCLYNFYPYHTVLSISFGF